MIDAFVTMCDWIAEALGLVWAAIMGWGTVGALLLAVLLFRRVARLVSRLIKR